MIKFILHNFTLRLKAIDGTNRQSIISDLPCIRNYQAELKNTRRAVKPCRVSFFNLIILSLIPLAEVDNCVACNREVSFATLFNSSGVGMKRPVRVLRHKKNSKNREWMKTLSSRSLEGNSYDGLADLKRVNEVCIAEQLNTFILSGLQTYFRICRVTRRTLNTNY